MSVSHFVVIRDYKPGDELMCKEIVREGAMATVNKAFISLIELTFQLTVLTTALMFIFVGIPFRVCILSIPGVSLFMYICIWSGHKIKALELTQDLSNIPRMYMSTDATGFWVAEAYEPLFMADEPWNHQYEIFKGNELKHRFTDVSTHRRTLVGTVGIVKSINSLDCAWLRKLAVKPKYRKIGIAKALLNEAVQFCSERGYSGIELITTEWQDDARNLFMKKSFKLRQMYHKQLISNLVMLLIYQFHYKIQPHKISITP